MLRNNGCAKPPLSHHDTVKWVTAHPALMMFPAKDSIVEVMYALVSRRSVHPHTRCAT
jgi:hypothetical protein